MKSLYSKGGSKKGCSSAFQKSSDNSQKKDLAPKPRPKHHSDPSIHDAMYPKKPGSVGKSMKFKPGYKG